MSVPTNRRRLTHCLRCVPEHVFTHWAFHRLQPDDMGAVKRSKCRFTTNWKATFPRTRAGGTMWATWREIPAFPLVFSLWMVRTRTRMMLVVYWREHFIDRHVQLESTFKFSSIPNSIRSFKMIHIYKERIAKDICFRKRLNTYNLRPIRINRMNTFLHFDIVYCKALNREDYHSYVHYHPKVWKQWYFCIK